MKGFFSAQDGARVARGMTFIETIFGVAIMFIVFLSLFGGFRLAIEIVYNAKARTGAIALITEHMEYMRGLPYEAVGTSGGIPYGSIPQLQQKTLNNISYTIRTLVQYVDAPEDGLGAGDTNVITADYKSVKVSVAWDTHGAPRSTFAVTRISPHGVESLTSGGTLRIEVFDATATPVPGATVHVLNNSVSPIVDVSASTDPTGAVIFPGTLPGSQYHIDVTKGGYSSSTTYAPTVQNPSPNPGDVSVVNALTTTASFGIDVMGTLQVRTFSTPGHGSFEDDFSNEDKLSATSSVAVTTGELALLFNGTEYEPLGFATSTIIAPDYLSTWNTLTIDATAPAGTSVVVRVYYNDGTQYTPVPDAALPGNSAGFSGGVIDLSTLPVAIYGKLKLEAVLETTDPAVSSSLSQWKVEYTAGPTPLPNIGFDIRGAKTIGASGGGIPIYKYDGHYTTSSAGEKTLTSMEWDAYTIKVTDTEYSVAERCPFAVVVNPGQTHNLSLTLASAAADSLLVSVSGGGAPVAGAAVSISGPSSLPAQNTSTCGQVFFSGTSPGTYTVTVTAPGYEPFSGDVSVVGAVEFIANLTAS